LLKPHGRPTSSSGPHQGYHLAEGADHSHTLGDTLQHTGDKRGNAPVTGSSFDDELVEGLLRIERDKQVLWVVGYFHSATAAHIQKTRIAPAEIGASQRKELFRHAPPKPHTIPERESRMPILNILISRGA
jgi:hypothetical protein